jgi:hypothetical protein
MVFMFEINTQNPWAFSRSKSIIYVYIRLSKYKYLAPMVILLLGWFVTALKHMAGLLEAAYFLYRVLRWPKCWWSAYMSASVAFN